ncbi:MAG: hypothetical protein RLZZ450_6331 [Pseudomonadota bacterium]
MKRVLIVDDDPDVTECLELMLQETYSVTLAENGALGLEKLRTESFDAVVLDVMMPVLDGVGVVEALQREGNPVPVILGSAMSNLRALATRLGVSDFIPKPYDFDLLLKKIAHAAQGSGEMGGGSSTTPSTPQGLTDCSQKTTLPRRLATNETPPSCEITIASP